MVVNGPKIHDSSIDFLSRRMMRFNAYIGGLKKPDFTVASDWELLHHYLFGIAGPFIDFLIYVDLGVGWSLKPVDFKDEEKGLEARDHVENELKKRDFRSTMIQFATYYIVLGRSCIIKTYDGLDNFFFDEVSEITGLDCINPMTLDMQSVEDFMHDTTGKKGFVQNFNGESVFFSGDRVIYRTNNNLSRRSVWGVSPLQRCVSDLRLSLKFPDFRNRLALKYANVFRVISIDSQKFVENVGDEAKNVLENSENHITYLDEIADFYKRQEKNNDSVTVFDWESISDISFAGKEVKLNNIELETLKNIALCLDLPLDLLRYDQVVNRSVMEVLADIFVSKQRAGARNHVYTPIIEGVANELLSQHNASSDGYLAVEYNPFLSRNKAEEASVIRDIWSTGALSKPEVREALGLPVKMNMGGDDWVDLDPLPDSNLKNNVKEFKGSKNPFINLNSDLDSVKSFLLDEGLIKKI